MYNWKFSQKQKVSLPHRYQLDFELLFKENVYIVRILLGIQLQLESMHYEMVLVEIFSP